MVGFTVTFVYLVLLTPASVAESEPSFIIPGSAAHLASELQAITRDISYIRILYPYIYIHSIYSIYIYTVYIYIQYIYIYT